MSYMTITTPTNKIVAAGKPLVEEARVETVANVYPGRLLLQGTNVDDIKVADDVSGNFVGWAGYEHTAPAFRPSTIGTIYVVEDKISVLKGGGFVILARAGGALASKGIPVKWATGGTVAEWSMGDYATSKIVGYTEDVSANDNVLIRSVL